MAAGSNLQDKKHFQEVRDLLASFSSEKPGTGTAVAYHVDPKNKVSIPEDMATSKAAAILAEAAVAEQEKQDFVRTFKYRPWDGAAALHRVMEKYFGTTGRGIPIKTFFGDIPPKMIEIEVAFGESIQVPWGDIAFATFEGVISLGASFDDEYGALFQITINCPKKYSAAVSGFFNLMESELHDGSIYKGQAIRGTDNPKFLPLTVDPSIVYNQDVYDNLDLALWGVIRHTELLNGEHTNTAPKVLLTGTYGTGKSETGRLTAKQAVDNGWTFIAHDPKLSSLAELEKTVQTARLLAPSVVFVEDVERFAGADPQATSRVLDLFDGISSKGHEVILLSTSNHPQDFNKGMLRAGRLDAMIEIGPLNTEALEKLIRTVCKDQLGKVDFETVWKAMAGYEPAFVRSTFDKARQSALIRQADKLKAAGTYSHAAARKFLLDTEDFVTAANSKRPQWEAHRDKAELADAPTVDSTMRGLLADFLTNGATLTNPSIGKIDVKLVEAADK
jgi:transitional endoplasmic reticulum ATPase